MIKIIGDSSCDMPLHYEQEYDITIVPLTVEIDGQLYQDRYEITPEIFFQKLEECKAFPKTSLAGPEKFLEQYRIAAEQGYDTVIVITIPAAASGTHQAARIAAEMMQEEHPALDITVVDSQMLCYPIGYQVKEAGRLAKEGASKQEILDRIRYIQLHTDVYFTVDSLKFLQKGGRISAAKAALGTILDLKPILTLKNGLVEQVENVRGEKKAMSRMVELITSRPGADALEMVSIGHGTVPGKVEFLRKKLEAALGRQEDETFEVGVVIGAHAGPGFSAVFVINPEFQNEWIK